MGNAERSLKNVRENERCEILAAGFNNKTDDIALMNIKGALLDQIPIHDCVEIAVISNIVYMRVDVVIRPTRLDFGEVFIFVPRLWVRHRFYSALILKIFILMRGVKNNPITKCQTALGNSSDIYSVDKQSSYVFMNGLSQFYNRCSAAAAENGSRHLVAIFGLLWVVVCAPLVIAFQPSPLDFSPPLVDYANHLARIHVLINQDDPVISSIYQSDWKLVPNLLFEFFMIVLTKIFPVDIAGRIFLALSFAAIPGSVLFLHYAVFKRLSLYPLIVFLFLYNYIFYMGFLGFYLSIALALSAIALWIVLEEKRVAIRIGIGAIVSILLLFSHLYALGLYGFVVGCIELCRFVRAKPVTVKKLLHSGFLVLQFAPALVLLTLMAGESEEPVSIVYTALIEKIRMMKVIIDDRNGLLVAAPLLPSCRTGFE